MRLFVATVAALSITGVATVASGDVLWSQAYDGEQGMASYNTNVGGTIRERRTADDFLVPGGWHWTDMTITVQMAIQGTAPPTADFFNLDLFDNTGNDGFNNPGAPGNLIQSFQASSFEFNGEILLGAFAVYDVVFELGSFELHAGASDTIFFLNPWMENFVIAQNVFFTSANTGQVNLSEVYVNFEDSTPGPLWYKASEHPDNLFSDEHDGAFLIEGTAIPAPGALALLGVAGLVARRRRRA